MEYDPDTGPDPKAWLELDEGERIDLVMDYHRDDASLPNARLHAATHVVVENQVAMGDEVPARAALERLMAEGLDRHDAVHAIASVVARHVVELLDGQVDREASAETYARALERLTAEAWRRGEI